MKRITCVSVLAIALLMVSCVNLSKAEAATNVRVNIPTFPVTLNGQTVDNTHSQYPLIVYKDITYFPLTYHYAQYLGLRTEWFNQTHSGNAPCFFVGNSNDRSKTLKTYPQAVANAAQHWATLPTYQLAINQSVVNFDNSKEVYPLLNFRGVTYFPMTWRFAHDLFDWQYHWSVGKGLVIDSREANRPNVDPRPLGWSGPSAAQYDVYYYDGDFYLVYPNSNIDNDNCITYCFKGEKPVSIDMKKALPEATCYYYNWNSSPTGSLIDPKTPAKRQGNLFILPAVQQKDKQQRDILIQLNLQTKMVTLNASSAQ